jgi:hypothetical protein
MTFHIKKSLILPILLLGGCASRPTVESDYFFLPSPAGATVSFEGETQAGGHEIHRIEVCRLAYVTRATDEMRPAGGSCVIYYAGDEYGPSILCYLEDCVDPFVRTVSTNVVEIYFVAGAHSHFRQTWKLLGYTAKLEKQEVIDWSDDPRAKKDAEQAIPPRPAEYKE